MSQILVIATHHGVFCTLAALRVVARGHDIVVVIPQSQIDKYKTFEGEIFQNYERNVKRFCEGSKKSYSQFNCELYVCADWDVGKKPQSAHRFLKTLGKTGKWLVLEAGSFFNDTKKPYPDCTTFGVVRARVFPEKQKLYEMIGEPAISETVSLSNFFVNLDDNSMRFTFLPSGTFHRPDALLAQSCGTLACLRYRRRAKDAYAENFWMEVIRKKQEKGEWVAYPYDTYLWTLEKGIISYLPEKTVGAIIDNGLLTEELYELRELDL